MKKFLTVLIGLTVCLGVVSGCFSGGDGAEKDGERFNEYRQELDYTESTERILNPDQGFYRPIYVKVTQTGVSYNKNIIDGNERLYHLRADISEFSEAVNGSADRLLTDAALNGVRELLSYIKSRDKNAVVRFAYDPGYNGNKDKEPNIEIIKKHIVQLCGVMNGFESTITAVETGLIGPWGEMHSSRIAKPEYITPVLGEFLNNTQNIPVLARTPKMIYDYLGITLKDIDGYSIDGSSKAYRLGIYNDGYLGSGNDLGTYTDRQKEIAFLSGQTDHLPFGGEVVVPSSSLHDIDKCLPEMFDIHLSYLNTEWNNEVIDKWKNSVYTAECGSDEAYYGKSAFTYIENRMGYRFVLSDSVFSYSDKFDELRIKLDVGNVGFGNLNKKKNAQLIFADGNGRVVLTEQVESFTGSGILNYSVNLNLDNGDYAVYLRLYGEEAEGVPLYLLQFANDLWNADLKANKIGAITISR